MSRFIVSFDEEFKDRVMKELKYIPGIAITGIPKRDGTVTIRTTTKTLDDEANAVHSVEDIEGVVDVRLLN